MAIFITIFIILLLLGIVFVLYACIVVGKASKTKEEIEYEDSAEMEYIKKCKEVKKQNKKNKYKGKEDKVIYL